MSTGPKITTRDVYFVGKCKACKRPTRQKHTETMKAETVLYTHVTGGRMERVDRYYSMDGARFTRDRDTTQHVDCKGCGKKVVLKRIAGTYNPHIKCNARCMSATGPQCECSCGGKNHGASFGG